MRIVELPVSAELMQQWLVQGNPTLAVEGIPADAEIVGARWQWPKTIVLTIRSESFAVVNVGVGGDKVPVLDPLPTYRRADP